VKDRDVASAVVGASGERIRRSVVVADHLERLDGVLPDEDVNVVDEEEAAGKPLVGVGTRNGYRRISDDVAISAPSANQRPEMLDFWTWLCHCCVLSRSSQYSDWGQRGDLSWCDTAVSEEPTRAEG
jgi:hypothetical protein